MTADRWHLVSRIYHDALAHPSSQRDALIRDACRGDDALEKEVRSLIAQSSSDSIFSALLTNSTATHLSLTVPGRVGRFELRGVLGAGGMGEVYRAHDPSLGRDIALKILPAAFTTDADRLARFEREARVLAALSHPHIAAIYGVESIESDGGSTAMRALVLELVEGTTLAERLRLGPLVMEDALAIARQIATALEAAHERGVVHRDLKPANIKIRPDGVVKVLDFGLAKAEAFDGETSAGMILGTPGYMSPEQARGLPVDKRADVWAFGCVLYEMLCGRAPFVGATPSDTLVAVLHHEPDWQALPGGASMATRRLLQRCLERNPQRRLKDLGDARLELDEPSIEAMPLTPPRRARAMPWIATLAIVACTAVAAGMWLRSAPRPRPIQFTLTPSDGFVLSGVPVPSPDGRQLVYVGRTRSGESALWRRSLDASAVRRLAGTDNAASPFWSADGQAIGFRADSVLKRIPVDGGPVQRVTDLDPTSLGATWNSDNVIVFTPSNKAPLHRVSGSGGSSAVLTTLNAERRENSHRWPQFLPDGRHFLFTARSDLPEQTAVYVASLDAPEAPKYLLSVPSRAIYVSSGHLLFVRDNALVVQPFDADRLVLSGDPIAVAGGVVADTAGANAEIASSADGAVVTYNTQTTSRLVWRDRAGMEVGAVPARGDFSQVRLSPDASRAVVVMPDPQNGNRDVWIVSLSTGALTRITSHPAADWFPVWSPDGNEVVFASDRQDRQTFYRAPAAGSGNERVVYSAGSPTTVFPTDWSPDGRTLLMHSYPRGNISLLPLAGPANPVAIVDSPYTDWVATFSPDGRWIAYVSDESGSDEIYVSAVASKDRYRVSVGGGVQPRWRRDGRELFFIGAGDKLVSVRFDPTSTYTPSVASPLFDACLSSRGYEAFSYHYDVTPNGDQSLWICEDSSGVSAVVMVHGLPSESGR